MPRLQRLPSSGTPLSFVIVLVLLIVLQAATILFILARPAPAVSIVERPANCSLPVLREDRECLRPIAGRRA